MGTAIAFAMKALELAPSIVSLGMNLAEHVAKTNEVLQDAQNRGGDPTEAQWAELDAKAADVHARIQRA